LKHAVAVNLRHEDEGEVPRQVCEDLGKEESEPPGCCGDGEHSSTLHQITPNLHQLTPVRRQNKKHRKPSAKDWNSWQWQLRSRIDSVSELAKMFPDIAGADTIALAAARFPMAIPPYYAALIRKVDDSDPIYRMSVPAAGEISDPSFLKADPLDEDHDMPVPGLVHRYADRGLLIATSMCAMYCRHCTRKRMAGQTEEVISPKELAGVVAYLREHTEIRDVIISGGDPLTLTDLTLERVVAAVRSVESVEIIRIGTRMPVTLPMRITPSLVRMLRRYQPLWVNTHFNHPVELTPEARKACARLVDHGIPMGNQTVLMRGINDDGPLLEKLFRELVRTRVRPYYLYQCDLVRGVEHFRTPISKGIEVMEYLRGRLTGFAIPTYVVDAPGGGGKIPVLPNYIVSMSPTHTVLRNFEGMLVSYPEPGHVEDVVMSPNNGRHTTVYDLSRGRATNIELAHSQRMTRRSTPREDEPLLSISQSRPGDGHAGEAPVS
jgi:lysine 2,3-aminomutase